MARKKKSKAKIRLDRIGLWATVWWGMTCVYLLVVVWMAKDFYAPFSTNIGSQGFFSDWASAIKAAHTYYGGLSALLALVAVVWVAISWVWLRELKRQKISYKYAFKDLFLTIRK